MNIDLNQLLITSGHDKIRNSPTGHHRSLCDNTYQNKSLNNPESSQVKKSITTWWPQNFNRTRKTQHVQIKYHPKPKNNTEYWPIESIITAHHFVIPEDANSTGTQRTRRPGRRWILEELTRTLKGVVFESIERNTYGAAPLYSNF